MAFLNWRDSVAQLLPPWLLSTWGEKFTGYLGLLQDFSSVGVSEAARAPWLREDTSPDDVLAMAGNDRAMVRYPYETDDQYRDRLIGVWDFKPYIGTEQGILGQLNVLGFGARLFPQREWSRPPVNHPLTNTLWWSRFFVVIDEYTGFSAGPVCGDPDTYCDDGLLCGITGDPAIIAAIRGIISDTRAAHEVCPEVIFSDGLICGAGHIAGDTPECGGDAVTFAT